jgi:hypothetical protein
MDRPRLKERWAQTLCEHPFRIAVVFFIVGVAVHAPFMLKDCFGEQDAARLAGRAVFGDLTGRLEMSGHWPFSYPLYIHLLYGLLQAQFLEASSLPLFMSLLSLFSSGLFSGVFALFAFRATSSLRVTVISGIGLQLCPVFFMNSIYGFPTIVALSLFMASVVIFQFAVSLIQRPRTAAFLYSSAAVLFIIAVLLKVDVLPASSLFLFPIWRSEMRKQNKIQLAAVVFIVSACSFWLLNQYGSYLSIAAAPSEHWSNWSNRFFVGIGALFSERNAAVLLRAAGILMLPAAAAAGVICIVSRRQRSLAFFLTAASLPIVLFWGVVEGNSARHNLIPSVFAPLLAALPLSFPSRRVVNIWTFVLPAVFIVDYFAYLPSSDTVVPSGRLAESAVLLRERCEEFKQFGKELAETKEDRIFVLAPPHRMPLYYFEVLSSRDLMFVKSEDIRLIMKKDGREKTFVFPVEHATSLAEKYLEEGYIIATDPD